jgi:hypothetical protein
MAKIVGTTLFKKFWMSTLSGTVMGESTRAETRVSGSVSGGGTIPGTGHNTDVIGSVSSTTTRYQTVFLKDDAGQEHVIETVDWPVTCRPGHRLTFLNLGRKGWFFAFNHNTQEYFWRTRPVRKIAFPHLFYFASSVPLAAVVAVPWASYIVEANGHGPGSLAPTFLTSALPVATIPMLILMLIPANIIKGIRMKKIVRTAHQAAQETRSAATGALAA